MTPTANPVQPPARLRTLVSWQAHKVATIGARLTASHMPLAARTEFAVLAALEEFGDLSQADLGRRLGLDRNEISTVLARLESEKAVTRTPDPADQRRNIVAATAAGQRHLDRLQAHADVVQDDLLARLTTTQRTQLTSLLAKVLEQHPGQPA
jgi:DNA-binding MarR family transcriptional regulator